MIYKLGLKLGHTYYKNSGKEYDEGDVEVYAYGFEAFWEPLLQTVALLLTGIIFGRGLEVLVFALAFLPIRFNAGGYHAKTSFRCTLSMFIMVGLFIVMISLIPLAAMFYLSIFCVLYSFYPIMKFAPFRDKTTPLGPNLAKIFRKRCLIIYFTGAVVIISLCVLGIILSFNSSPPPHIISYICASLALGQFAASSSLFAAKVKETRAAIA